MLGKSQQAVLLSNRSYEELVNKYKKLEERIFELEVARRITEHDTEENLKTYTSEEIGIDLTGVEWSEDDGWE